MTALLVQTKLTVVDEIELRRAELQRLLVKYIPEFKKVYKGWRSPGTEDIEFPCAMIEWKGGTESMESAGTFDLRLPFDILFYVLDSDPDALAVKQSNLMACLTKLFSNNGIVEYIAANPADADAPATNKFKSNGAFWDNSEMTEMQASSLFKWSGDRNEYCRAGRLGLMLQAQQVK